MESNQYTKPLTAKQAKLVVFIHDYIQEHNYPPCHEEMWELMGVKSVNNQITSAVKKGWLVRDEVTKQRNLSLTPEGKKRIDTLRTQSSN